VAERIPVYGQLISSYPVSGGVVVQDDTVYAAAGITHYDGTYVVALDARTGQVKARNETSGVLDAKVNNGISLQGNLQIVDGELRFLAGGVYETARYDLATLKCLNQPVSQVSSQFRTAFYPYYPVYGKFVSLDYMLADGHLLNHDASYEGSLFTNLALHAPLPAGEERTRKEAARWLVRRGQKPPQTVWRDKNNRRFTSFIVSGDTLLATGHPDASPDKPFLVAMNISDGSDLWLRQLPADAVKGGCAVDHDGHIYLTLENGTLVCFN
jgi:outer membrane protein assembly factor BamB